MVPTKWESDLYAIGSNPKEVSFPKPKPVKPWVAKGKPLTQKLGRTRRVGLPTKMFCIHCKAHKGRYWTHNTLDCCIGSSSK